VRISFVDGAEVLTSKLHGKPLSFNKPRGNTRPQNYINWASDEKDNIKSWIFAFKQRLLEDGILCFDDAYSLAMKAIIEWPLLKTLLGTRFRYVFVDEMQDMDKHQYDLLESLFEKDSGPLAYQRIGDRNQSIYGSVKSEDIWESAGKTILPINGSCRFSQEVSKVVQAFSITREAIQSVATHVSVKPYLLIYQDDTIEIVIDKFIQIINEKKETGQFPDNPEHPIKAIGWRKNSDDSRKIILKHYFPDFAEGALRTKVDHANLLSYLTFSGSIALQANMLGGIQKNILNGILKILRMENIATNNGRLYTSNKMLQTIKEKDSEEYDNFRLKLYRWCRELYLKKVDEVHEELKRFLPVFFEKIFGKDVLLPETVTFINATDISEEYTEIHAVGRPDNIYRKDGIEVQIATIHASKGETHSATLYLETYYQSDGGKSFESQRLKESFKGNFAPARVGKRVLESLKMAYVGMSRPTHLLCVAVHKNRIAEYVADIPNDLWDVVEV